MHAVIKSLFDDQISNFVTFILTSFLTCITF